VLQRSDYDRSLEGLMAILERIALQAADRRVHGPYGTVA
jgi:hypothetical protein